MLESSSHNFDLALTADDLYDYTLEICGKQANDNGDKTYRFPMYTYPNYVSRILDIAGDIHQDIIMANESFDFEERIRLENDAIGKCVYLNHLTRLAANRGWISEKQLKTSEIEPQVVANYHQGWRTHASWGDCGALIKSEDKWLTEKLAEMDYIMIIKPAKKKPKRKQRNENIIIERRKKCQER